MKNIRQHPFLSGLVGLVLMGTLFALYGFVVEPSRLVLREVDLSDRVQLGDAGPLRVAFVTDLHTGSPFNGLAKVRRVVGLVNAQEPDLIILGGDFLISGVKGGHYVEPEDIAQELEALSAPLGVYSVLGNHDWWEDGAGMWAALESVGITVLENDARQIQSNGATFNLVGLSDDTTRQPDFDLAFSQIERNGPTLVVAHDPASFLETSPPLEGVLFLAGHTHGGQVYLPWLFDPIVPGRAGPEWAKGLVVAGRTPLFVSSGVGTSILPVRLNAPPEVIVLTLGGSS